MPRRYYSRRTRVVRPRKKWATNFATIGDSTMKTVNMTPGQVATLAYDHTLVENTAQSASPTPVIVKAGNFKVKGDMRLTLNLVAGQNPPSLISCVLYVVYVPEGITPTASIITTHPEWIMAWSPVDLNMSFLSVSTQYQDVTKFSFSSRLKRNLNSGDRIVCLTVFNFEPDPNTTGAETVRLVLSPAVLCQYWTCSN